MKLIRYLQGERPGLGSELMMPDSYGEKFAAVSLFPSIVVQQNVLLADVSYYQAVIDFAKMKAEGIQGVLIRAGQRNWPDSRFKENWAKARAAGLPRGSYWLYDSREEPKKQAALWWSLIQEDPGELVHVADLEESYGGPYFRPEHMKAFLQEFQRLSGLPRERIAIYTAYYWWLARVGVDTWWKQYDLWLAWYADMSVVRIPGPWSEDELLFWQHTASGDGTRYGVGSLEIDLSWYCGTLAQFKQRFNLSGGTPPPPTGDNMQGQVLVSLNIRKTPDTVQLPVGKLLAGDIVEASVRSNGWWRLTKITRGVNVPLPAAECYAYEGDNNGYIKLLSEPAADRPKKITVEMESGKVFVATQFTEQV